MSTVSSPSSDLLTRREAAKYLGVAEQTLAAWQSLGRSSLPIVRIGTRLVRYRRRDLDAWLAKRVEGGDAA